MSCPARDLVRGDLFMLQLCGEVLKTAVVAGGKRISVRIALLDMHSLEFAYGESVIELLVKPGRHFQVHGGRRGGRRRGGPAPDPAPRPREKVPA